MKKFETLEDAQAEIIRLNERLTEVETERDSLSQNNDTLTSDNARLRALNTSYFEKLSQQYVQPEKEKEQPPAAPSCEDFAKTLII